MVRSGFWEFRTRLFQKKNTLSHINMSSISEQEREKFRTNLCIRVRMLETAIKLNPPDLKTVRESVVACEAKTYERYHWNREAYLNAMKTRIERITNEYTRECPFMDREGNFIGGEEPADGPKRTMYHIGRIRKRTGEYRPKMGALYAVRVLDDRPELKTSFMGLLTECIALGRAFNAGDKKWQQAYTQACEIGSRFETFTEKIEPLFIQLCARLGVDEETALKDLSIPLGYMDRIFQKEGNEKYAGKLSRVSKLIGSTRSLLSDREKRNRLHHEE